MRVVMKRVLEPGHLVLATGDAVMASGPGGVVTVRVRQFHIGVEIVAEDSGRGATFRIRLARRQAGAI